MDKLRGTIDHFKTLSQAAMSNTAAKDHFQLLIQSYEDDRDPANRRFFLIKEMVKGKTLSEQVQHISQLDLACLIRNFAIALSSFGQYEPFRQTPFSENTIIFKGDEGLKICGSLNTKLDFS